ncbi:prolyl-tRNA synthetase [Colletotrichum orchidophilum]|uniref:proline--tRNA ligase n=1 Tax=Colletotrichum orchidophilum TaxID=1209926 RepID=A0A1G4BSK3_9PEZI|nr:prolyl-tRNA synthetase [Colletotrichum orchidophilum]OHF04343.1 prolyl-tRNA synthetase [Colletotrichum orchidophilum]
MAFSRAWRLRVLPSYPSTMASYGSLPFNGSSQSSSRSYRVGRARNRLSAVWVPTGGMTPERGEESAHEKLVRAGFLRQSHSGIFHLLPLGQRVQNKLEGVIDYYMQELGASRVALSTITSKDLWQRSGRLTQLEAELFGFEDRKGSKYMLSPTHEEEITTLVAKTVKSYKELPLRLYQITRKFRDELRPRHGLLRTREFTMKDLYTFDVSAESALETYQKVQLAYTGVFKALKLPVMVAKASSGDMGGDLSHEYHLPTSIGEDTVVTCNNCNYAANAEIAESRAATVDIRGSGGLAEAVSPASVSTRVWRGISKDRKTLVNAWYPGRSQNGSDRDTDIRIPAIKSIVTDLDASTEDAVSLWQTTITSTFSGGDAAATRPRIINIIDSTLSNSVEEILRDESNAWPISGLGIPKDTVHSTIITKTQGGQPINLLAAHAGDKCPCCDSGALQVQKALELGHTFYLGTRYSEPLEAMVSIPTRAISSRHEVQPAPTERKTPMQMGCHGIGVSRLIGAVAEHLKDTKGLQWPRVIAPYEVVVISTPNLAKDAIIVYDEIAASSRAPGGIDLVLDDRAVSFAWKLNDADLVGYPVLVILGKVWKERGDCEVQCRRLGIKEMVPLRELHQRVADLLEQL